LKFCPLFRELLFAGNPEIRLLTCVADAFLKGSEVQHILHLVVEVGRESGFE